MPTIKGGIKIEKGKDIPAKLIKYANFPFEASGLKLTGNVQKEILDRLEIKKEVKEIKKDIPKPLKSKPKADKKKAKKSKRK